MNIVLSSYITNEIVVHVSTPHQHKLDLICTGCIAMNIILCSTTRTRSSIDPCMVGVLVS